MKQTLVATGLALMVGLVPVSFISQTVSAVSLPSVTDQVASTKKTVDDAVTNGNSEIARQTHQATNNGNHGVGNNGNTENSGNSNDSDGPIPENRFTAAKLRACERHQDQITSNISQISDRGTKQLEVFHSIAQRAKAFYAAKGYNVPQYDDLVTAVDTLYDQSLVAVNATQTNGEAWSCNGANPTAQLTEFQQAKQTEMTTLAAYKDKIHELLVLIKTAADTTATNSTGGAQ